MGPDRPKKDRGFKLGTDAKIVRYPDRYIDERGIAMWSRVHEVDP